MAGMVVVGLFNAFAFAGAGFLFNKLNHSGYKDEIKRHNIALEQLTAAKQKWYEKEVTRKNNIELKRHQLITANADIKTTNRALAELNKYIERSKLSNPEPTIQDYYTPSKEMENYQLLTMGAVGLGTGLVGYKVYKRAVGKK